MNEWMTHDLNLKANNWQQSKETMRYIYFDLEFNTIKVFPLKESH